MPVTTPASSALDIPAATVERLPHYVRALERLAARGVQRVSSAELAEAAGAQAAQVRRDLSYFGSLGTRGVGYAVDALRDELGRHIGATFVWPIVIVGVGNLGTALCRQFSTGPYRVVAAVDSSPDLVGQPRGGVVVRAQNELADAVRDTGAVLGIITVPVAAAQAACDALVASGVRSILNFAPVPLEAPDDVHVRAVDLAQELAVLAFGEQHRRQAATELHA